MNPHSQNQGGIFLAIKITDVHGRKPTYWINCYVRTWGIEKHGDCISKVAVRFSAKKTQQSNIHPMVNYVLVQVNL